MLMEHWICSVSSDRYTFLFQSFFFLVIILFLTVMVFFCFGKSWFYLPYAYKINNKR